jgi:LysM repeat protein
MKNSHFGKLSLVFGLSALLVGCDDDEKEKPNEGGGNQPQQSTTDLAREARFGPWVSKAQLQFQMEKPDFKGKFYSEVEGRLQGSTNQYRAITGKLDDEKYRACTAIWGLTEEELYDTELTYLRAGFERNQSQTFTDSSGTAIHQLVMLCPLDTASPDIPPITSLGPPPPGIVDAIEDAPDGTDDAEDAATIAPETGLTDLAFEVIEDTEMAGESLVTPPVVETDPGIGTKTTEIAEEVEISSDGPEVMEITPDPPIPEESEVAEVVEEPEPDPVVEEPEPEPEPVPITYTVVSGDTLSSIARRYKVTISAIKKENGLRSDMIRLKQVLKIPTK